jgi:hypothetical protein
MRAVADAFRGIAAALAPLSVFRASVGSAAKPISSPAWSSAVSGGMRSPARWGLAKACGLMYPAAAVQRAVIISLILVLVAGLVAPATSGPERPLGAWTVWERTDVKTCAAWHTSTPDVWMTRDGLTITPHGGISVFRYRVGDEPMQVRLATPHERATGAIEVAGRNLTEAIEAGRLKVEVLTTLHTLYQANVDLSNGNEVLRAVRACS